jgi:hypothetical protein
MSGRKYAEYQVERSIREALQCGMDAADLAAEADSQLQALAELADGVPAVKAFMNSVESVVGEVRQRLDVIERELTAKRWFGLSLERVGALRAELANLRNRLRGEVERCRASQHAAASRLQLAALVRKMALQALELRAWTADAFDEFQRSVEKLVAQADASVAAGSPAANPFDVESLVRRWGNLRDGVDQMRLQNCQRQYVYEALTKVCQSLGYEVHSQPSERPTDDLVAEVNTFSHGMIRFRLQLDGVIRSESTMIPHSCDRGFGAIEDKLRKIGVMTAFHYEDDRPVRVQLGSKSLPDADAPSAHADAGEGCSS